MYKQDTEIQSELFQRKTPSDDFPIYGASEKDLQINLTIWPTTLKKYMNINRKVVASICIQFLSQPYTIASTHSRRERISNGRKQLQRNVQGDQKTRQHCVIHLTPLLCIRKKEVSTKRKIIIFKTIYKPTLMCVYEGWM